MIDLRIELCCQVFFTLYLDVLKTVYTCESFCMPNVNFNCLDVLHFQTDNRMYISSMRKNNMWEEKGVSQSKLHSPGDKVDMCHYFIAMLHRINCIKHFSTLFVRLMLID